YTIIIYAVYRWRYGIALGGPTVAAITVVTSFCFASMVAFLLFGWIAAMAVAIVATGVALVQIRRLLK
ncbi:MAG: hypothetical protein IK120_07910, partial [Muribaculaceae bacterium]|nr:hypothetical protein [Muribaculaceae bacterium]